MTNSFSNKDQRPPGFPCAKCNFFIEVTMQGFLASRGFTCPKCLTTFSVDREASSEALQLVQKLNVAMTNLEEVSKFKK